MRTDRDSGPPSPTLDERPSLFELGGELAGAGLELVHNTAELAASEARVIVRRLVVRVSLLLSLLVIASTGLLLVLGGAAFLLVEVAQWPRWAAFGLVGLVTMAGAGFFALRAVKQLGNADLAFPRTLAEIKKDVEAFGATRRPVRVPDGI
jgi:hypothetical protein